MSNSPSASMSDSQNESSGGCPIQKRGNSSCPIDHGSNCPVQGVPASIEESLNHPQTPHPSQNHFLSTQRVVSTIPRETEGKWEYPSDQQFYNAIRRKGYTAPLSDIPSIVQIHNSVNERSWMEVRKWEKALRDCDDPKLVRFLGRPNDLSPKAWINTNLFFYNPPFDRHDWLVEGVDGSTRRYVIDFYKGGEEKKGVNMYLDVRPALDGPGAFLDRAKMMVMETLPGIFGGVDREIPARRKN